MKIKKKMRGITLVGFLIMLFFLGFFVYAGMQLGPVYMDHYSVIKAMRTVADEAGKQTPSAIKTRLAKLLNVSYVTNVKSKDFKVIRGNGRELQVKYEVRKDFLYNIDFILNFEEKVSLN